MSLLTADCPRCRAKHVTFDVEAQQSRGIVEDGWVERFEVFAVCRHCHTATLFVIDNTSAGTSSAWRDVSSGIVKYTGYLNDHFAVRGHISLKDEDTEPPPEYVPGELETVYKEGATCVSVQCWNAAGAMFRLVIDMATKSRLPPADQEPNAKIRRSLGLRLQWLFDNGKLPDDLRELADCIKEDGNDGAHDGTLTKNEALDLRDFTYSLLERLYTAPKRLELAAARRRERRGDA
ncbi:DUF4145 domain-containing protein [Rhizobium leguminosarum bv. viciae]|uniref:DUF4145 domain-containing protein n=1 Tax=Rhizobium leguminosarum TaxID=384 RepID=UPI0014420843|nr:DUF4145 domain-containing protein [Rhizobium leguminosarum]NKK62687.1 DUF4145 domain-containing protein [Rhizobium leguminosarum bv. viciae]